MSISKNRVKRLNNLMFNEVMDASITVEGNVRPGYKKSFGPADLSKKCF